MSDDAPSATAAGDSDWCLRLRGEVAGRVRTFYLGPGEHRVGSSSASDIVLAVAGVSRQHAMLVVLPEPTRRGGTERAGAARGAAGRGVPPAVETRLVVEDRGSTNGTTVDGAPVQRAAVAPGMTLGFGPVHFAVERVSGDDARLAVVLDPPAIAGAAADSDATDSDATDSDATDGDAGAISHSATVWLPGDGTVVEGATAAGGGGATGETLALRWLGLLEEIERRCRLPADPGAIRGAALALLVDRLGAAGGQLIAWGPPTTGAAVVLAAHGELGEPPPLATLLEASRREPAPRAEAPAPDDGEVRSFHLPGPPALTGALGRDRSAGRGTGTADRHLGLLVWGELPGRRGCGPLLRLLLDRLADPGSPTGGSPRPADARADDISAPNADRSADHRQPAAPWVADSTPPSLRFPAGYRPGAAPAMRSLYRQLGRLVNGDLPLLIVGETGVGKELVARTVHASGDRRGGPLVAINCAAIPADLQEAELFGIGGGVATGVKARPGKFRQAEGGILFLDEVGEMAPPLQAKLLRALQEKEIAPLGGAPRQVDVRIVAATNVDLSDKIRRGELRSDLYYRLAGYVLEVPPLRRCRGDLPGLAEHFLRREAERLGITIQGLTVAALRRLVDYRWPGNIRQLAHEMRRLVTLSDDGQVIDSGMLSHELQQRPFSDPAADPDSDPASDLGGGRDASALALEPRLAELEERLIRRALAEAGGVQLQAARLLGIHRNSLAHKLKRLAIEPG